MIPAEVGRFEAGLLLSLGRMTSFFFSTVGAAAVCGSLVLLLALLGPADFGRVAADFFFVALGGSSPERSRFAGVQAGFLCTIADAESFCDPFFFLPVFFMPGIRVKGAVEGRGTRIRGVVVGVPPMLTFRGNRSKQDILKPLILALVLICEWRGRHYSEDTYGS